MMSQKSFKRWYWVHKWSSLICTVILLLLCITGLPLIFHDEIDQLTHAASNFEENLEHGQADLNAVVAQAKSEQPGWELMFLSWSADEPIVNAILGPSMTATESEVAIIPFDTRNGVRLNARPSNEGVMFFILDLHASLLLGLPGSLFLSLMGILFVIAMVSGVVVYTPYMRRLKFGTVRKHYRKRIKWLDVHNLTGIVTLGWVAVVTITGIILTLVTPITAIWQSSQLATLTAPYQGVESSFEPVPINTVINSVFERIPDADISFVSWPNSPYATPYHYTVAVRGNTPLTQYLLKIIMVDAREGHITNIEDTPWYLSAVNLSVPLHFGDYGALPLKIIWALLDVVAIIVLGSGVYLWLSRRKQSVDKRLYEAQQLAAVELSE